MKISRHFRKRFFSSFWVIVLLVAAIILIQNEKAIKNWLGTEFNIQFERNLQQEKMALENALPLDFIPVSPFKGELIYKPNFIVYYDEAVNNARYTFHLLKSTNTKGNASRSGVRFNDDEQIGSNTAQYGDFSHTGYDRGHLVPAGDFQCCQNYLEETFAMSNIAPFDSVLNRHAWNELEIQTRKWARRFGQVYVFTGPVISGDQEIGRYNDVSVPSYFYKIIAIPNKNGTEIAKVSAFLIPNKPIYRFESMKYAVSIDKLEALTELNFFPRLNSQKEIELESRANVFNK